MIKTRPRRLYYFQPADSYYYIIGGKKKKLKTDKKISQKQLAKINITNIIGVPQAKRVQKRKKRRTVKMQKDISSDILKPATQMGVSFYVPKKEIPELGKLQSTGTKNEELAKIVGELVKGEFAKIPKPITEPPKKEKVKETPIKISKPVETPVKIPQPINESKTPSKVISEKKAIDIISTYYEKNNSVPQLKTFNSILSSRFYEPIDKERYAFYKKKFNDSLSFAAPLETDLSPVETVPPTSKDEEKKQEAAGLGYDSDDDGLFNDELSKLLYYKTNKVVPVIASDELHSLLKYVEPKQKYFTAVINTNPSSSDGSGNDGYPSGHWRCFFIDNRDDYLSAEFYDPLADAPEPSVIKIMKKICEIMNPEKMFLYKQNMVKHQSDSSSNCGHFVLKFIDDRANGVSWSKATGFDDVIDKSKDGEKMIEKYKSYL